jgi:hypothetical protein
MRTDYSRFLLATCSSLLFFGLIILSVPLRVGATTTPSVVTASTSVSASSTIPIQFREYGNTIQAGSKSSSTVATSSSIELNLSSSTLSVVASTTVSVAASADFLITVDDILKAGYHGVKQIPAVSGRFSVPVHYFRVTEKVSPEDALRDCADCGNLVAVYVTNASPTSTPGWVAERNPFVQKIGGRIQVKWFAGDRTVFVTAPGTDVQVRALASWFRERMVLNKTF